MTMSLTRQPPVTRAGAASHWLKRYYFTRFLVSALWVLLAFAVARHVPPLAAVMLIGYPAWDALANYVDALRSGGLARNRAQALNVAVSLVTSFAVSVALGRGPHAVLFVFGVWAWFSGVLQLAAAAKRWKTAGAQWAMILSGAQSALAASFMIKMAIGTKAVGIADVAPYAAFGAFYFLVSALSLTVSDARKATKKSR
ncbi:DUF308 domain-containing protein [Sphingomonas morindae]|uniref:DUF308 domain-containing protein n=1 Tax=Sphingomonas morindae TaxID=1541170 RepID=A0ABY4XDR1_9SPHN|nr:DUF308 domain-containing protein [Sphingomonas morindae]USI75052.1 DUF308 domain-containing protein [Sphingomonas morindae]